MDINKFNQNVTFLLSLNPISVYFVLFGILILCGFGLPVPEDIILITGGYLAYEDLLNEHVMCVLGLAGVLIGDSTMFLLGRRFGPLVLENKYISKIITKDKISKAQKYLSKYGNKIFFIARFLPGLRSPIFFTGGTLKIPFYVFFMYDSFAALISVPVWVYAAFYGGEYIYKVITWGRDAQMLVLFIIICFVSYKVYTIYKKQKKKKREKEERKGK
ncbi:MAG: DedA family protein [Oligoflexia bacterium]|nr:DedA family protein [Oligoflexia bacterium]